MAMDQEARACQLLAKQHLKSEAFRGRSACLNLPAVAQSVGVESKIGSRYVENSIISLLVRR